MNVIETSDLGKRYGKTWALRECTLAIPEGRLAALVGPNGAGKSTLMNNGGRADRPGGRDRHRARRPARRLTDRA
jgi:ABC-2 type transport system ATP-binding protein